MKGRIRILGPMVLWLVLTASRGAQNHDHSAMAVTDGQFNPYVLSDGRGGFFLAYVERKAGSSNLMLQHSAADGSFSAAVRVNNRPGDAAVRNENPPKIAIGSKNEVYVVWASERERWKGNIRFARSLNGGQSFEPAIDLNSDAAQRPISRAFQSIVVDAKGRIFVAWIDERNKTTADRGAEIWMAMSTDRGKTFSHDRKILANVCECCRTALAVDSAGRIYVSYRLVPPTGPMLRDIAVARSDDDGTTFVPSIVNRDGWELNACPIDGATLAIDSADRIHVVWFTQTGDTPRLYIASSTDHGSSFSKPAVFDSAQKLAKHAHVVAVDKNRLLVAWDDLNGTSMVKWGFFDSTTRSMRFLGTQSQASYPMVAMSSTRLAIVAMRSNQSDLFRMVQATTD
jgi:hypothetical protein